MSGSEKKPSNSFETENKGIDIPVSKHKTFIIDVDSGWFFSETC
jgi:hypothetical protein